MADTDTRLAIVIEAQTKSFENAMKRLEATTNRAIGGSTRSIGLLDTRLASMAKNFVRSMATFAGVAGVGMLARTVTSILHDVDRLADAAAKIGITTDALQELRFAGDQAGVEMGSLDDAMSKFSKNIGDASRGGGELAKVFAANGVRLRDNAGNLRSVSDLLAVFADLVKNASSEQEQLLLATIAFGRGGDDMVNILRGGSVALRAWQKDAHEAGVILDKDLVQKSSELADKWDRFTGGLTTSFQTFVLTVVTGAARVVGAINSITESHDQARDKIVREMLNDMAGVDRAKPGVTIPGNVNDLNIAGFGTPISKAAPTKPTILPSGSNPEMTMPRLRPEIELLSDAMVELRDNSRDALGTFVDGLRAGKTATEAALDALNRLADKLISAGLDMAVNTLFGSIGLGGNGSNALLKALGVGNGLNALAGIGGRAGGGSVMSGRPYMVGERGPELFVPRIGGTVVPNGGTRGGTVVNIVNQSGGQVSQTRRQSGDGRSLIDIVIGAVKNDMAQGGFDSVSRGRFGVSPLTRRLAGT